MIIDRYLARQIFFPTAAITGLIVFITMSGRLSRWLASALTGGPGSSDLLYIVCLYIPKFLQEALPAGLLLGILVGYGKLFSELEMTALSAGGFSQKDLIRATLKPVLLLVVLMQFNNLVITPFTQKKAAEAWAEIGSVSPLEVIRPGSFTSLGKKGGAIYVQSFDEEKGMFKDVFLSRSLDEVYVASNGFINTNSETDNRYLVLTDGYVERGRRGSPGYSLTQFDTYGILISTNEVRPRLGRQTMTTVEVFDRLERNDMFAELQWRILSPFNLIVTMLIAIPLSRINPRQGRFAKIVPALIIFSTFTFVQDEWFRSIMKGELPRWAGLYIYQASVIAITLIIWFAPGWVRAVKVKYN